MKMTKKIFAIFSAVLCLSCSTRTTPAPVVDAKPIVVAGKDIDLFCQIIANNSDGDKIGALINCLNDHGNLRSY